MAITKKQVAPSTTIGNAPVDDFHTAEVVTVAGAHGAHDTYFSFLPTILPLLIEKFSLSTAQAGMLSAFSQIPNLLQPVIGLLADRKNLKMLVVLAPAISGCLITLMGVAPTYGTTALLLLLAGFSTAGFHSIAPGMVGAHSGRKVGRGMGFFMVGGERGFSGRRRGRRHGAFPAGHGLRSCCARERASGNGGATSRNSHGRAGRHMAYADGRSRHRGDGGGRLSVCTDRRRSC